MEALTDEEVARLPYDWGFWARPNQHPPEQDFFVWLLKTGRGFGKTRSGSEFIRRKVDEGAMRIHLVGRTAADVRDVMVKGPSGLENICPPWNPAKYESSKRRVIWPATGAQALLFSADEPEALRGPEAEYGWADEAAAWRFPDAWDNFIMGLRLGRKPQVCVTTTPKRAKIMKAIEESPELVMTRGSMYENMSNLPQSFLSFIERKYGGTTLGQQEVYGEDLQEAEGALWKRSYFDDHRVKTHPALEYVAVAVDPSGSDNTESDECGIVAGGVSENGHAYILEDATKVMSPDEWAKRTVTVYDSLHADRVFGETNYGGDMVEHTLRTAAPYIPFKKVVATRGKVVRAEPVVALYEQGRVHHVGYHAELEDECCTWVPGESKRSPNRVDALVWLLFGILLSRRGARVLSEISG